VAVCEAETGSTGLLDSYRASYSDTEDQGMTSISTDSGPNGNPLVEYPKCSADSHLPRSVPKPLSHYLPMCFLGMYWVSSTALLHFF
jgi:hypothetical protein